MVDKLSRQPNRAGRSGPKLSKPDAAAIVKEAREAVQESWDFDSDNRREAATDLSFLAGNQWPAAVKRERDESGRPMLTINRLPQFVRQITNDIRQADLAIKVSPEDDASDPHLAKIYNGLLRLIQYKSSAKHVFSTAAEHQAGCGIGWFRVASKYVDDQVFEQELRIEGIRNPLSVYCDPSAVLPDRSDAMWIIVTEMLPKSKFKRKYPKAGETSVDVPIDSGSQTFFWATEDGVRVAEYWRKVPVTRTLALLEGGETVDITDMGEGEAGMLPIVETRPCETHRVEMFLISGSDVLEGPVKWGGRHIPLIPVIGGEWPLDSKTYRYGAIRFARDPQQLYNFYRTATAEAIALAPKAPYVATAEQIGPYKQMWDTAHTKNRPYLLYKPDPNAPNTRPSREHPPEMPAALMQEAQVASDDMKGTTGIYDAALGAKSNETAGIAIRSRQIESDVANYHFADNLQRSLEHCGRVLIDLIPKIYDSERIIRLMGEDGKDESLRINQQVMADDGIPMLINDLSAATFDVRVTLGRSYQTKRMETADALIEFMRAIPGAAEIMGDLVAKALDFPDADIIAKRLRNVIPPHILADKDDPEAPQPPDPMQDPVMQIEMAGKQAEADLKTAQADKARAEAAKITLEAGQLEQAGINPQVVEPEFVDPDDYAIKQAGVRKANADADLAELSVEHKRGEIERGPVQEPDLQAPPPDQNAEALHTLVRHLVTPKRITRDERGSRLEYDTDAMNQGDMTNG